MMLSVNILKDLSTEQLYLFGANTLIGWSVFNNQLSGVDEEGALICNF